MDKHNNNHSIAIISSCRYFVIFSKPQDVSNGKNKTMGTAGQTLA